MTRRFGWAVVLFGLFLTLFPTGLRAQSAYESKTGHAEFTSSMPGFTFTGKSDHLVGKITLPDSTVDFYLDLTTVDTGIGMRNRDMRGTLDTKKYPFASFYGKLISPFDVTRKETQPATVTGEFKVHGVSRQVTIQGKLTPTDRGLQVEASWTLLLKNYNIKPPSILFYKVDQEQKIHIKTLLTPIQ